jgi:hypothetical protein
LSTGSSAARQKNLRLFEFCSRNHLKCITKVAWFWHKTGIGSIKADQDDGDNLPAPPGSGSAAG